MRKPIKLKLSLRDKTLLVICSATLVLMVTGLGMGYFLGRSLLFNSIGSSHVNMANLIATHISERIDKQADDIKILSNSQFWIRFIVQDNLRYSSLSGEAMGRYALDMNKKWPGLAQDDPLLKEYLNSELGIRLRDIAEKDKDIVEIFVVNKYGGLVASSYKTSEFYQADELWWKKAYNNGKGSLFISNIEFDTSSNTLSFVIAAPIADEKGEIVGVCKAVISTEIFFMPLNNLRVGQSGHAVLVDGDGNIIFHSEIKPMSAKFCDTKCFRKFITNKVNYGIIAAPHIHKGKIFTAFAQVNSPLLLKEGIVWRVFIDQDVSEAFAPLYRLIWSLIVLFVILFMMMIALGFIFGSLLVRPIKELYEATQKVSRGDLSYKIDIQTGDEIEELAESFNKMTNDLSLRMEEARVLFNQAQRSADAQKKSADELKQTYTKLQVSNDELKVLKADLEQRVEDRTKDLSQAQQAALNILEDLQETKYNLTMDKAKMDYMVESAVEGILMLDNNGEIITINPRARQMLGFEIKGDISGQQLIARLTALVLLGALEECKEKKAPVSQEIVLKQAKVVVLHCNISPVKDAQGFAVGILFVFRDITREKEIDNMKSEFVSTVSHELRTPLSITKEGICLVIDEIPGKINEKQKKMLTIAKDNIDRLARIIDELLDVSKIEAGKMGLHKESIDMVDLIKEISLIFQPKIKEKGLELKLDMIDKRINVYADADRIIQVFTNLISNAIRFTPKGQIEISCKEDNNMVECSIADTGVGIANIDLSKVFDKFQQFHRSPGAGDRGTGLGLSICKGIIEMHNGNIQVESELNKGTKFTFTLPKYVGE